MLACLTAGRCVDRVLPAAAVKGDVHFKRRSARMNNPLKTMLGTIDAPTPAEIAAVPLPAPITAVPTSVHPNEDAPTAKAGSTEPDTPPATAPIIKAQAPPAPSQDKVKVSGEKPMKRGARSGSGSGSAFWESWTAQHKGTLTDKRVKAVVAALTEAELGEDDLADMGKSISLFIMVPIQPTRLPQTTICSKRPVCGDGVCERTSKTCESALEYRVLAVVCCRQLMGNMNSTVICAVVIFSNWF